MRDFNRLFKSKQEWEQELLDCLDDAKKAYEAADEAKKPAALKHYQAVFAQFQQMVFTGKIPPKDPCYTSAAATGT